MLHQTSTEKKPSKNIPNENSTTRKDRNQNQSNTKNNLVTPITNNINQNSAKQIPEQTPTTNYLKKRLSGLFVNKNQVEQEEKEEDDLQIFKSFLPTQESSTKITTKENGSQPPTTEKRKTPKCKSNSCLHFFNFYFLL